VNFVEKAAAEYGLAHIEWLRLKSEMKREGGQCSETYRPDDQAGDPGNAPCYMTPGGEMCEHCARATALRPQERAALRACQSLRKKLQRILK